MCICFFSKVQRPQKCHAEKASFVSRDRTMAAVAFGPTAGVFSRLRRSAAELGYRAWYSRRSGSSDEDQSRNPSKSASAACQMTKVAHVRESELTHMAAQMLNMEDVRSRAEQGLKPHQRVLEGCCLRGAESATCTILQALPFHPLFQHVETGGA